MPRNLEFKAKVGDLNSLEKIFIEHGAVFIEVLNQTDTYFCVPHGRLKLREERNQRSEDRGQKQELIFYERDETSAMGMISQYAILPIPDSSIKNFLVKPIGIKTIVEKERRLLKLENARIHLDRVKDLGQFLEFEVVSEGNDVEDAKLLDELKNLAAQSVIEEINDSYSDLMLAKSKIKC